MRIANNTPAQRPLFVTSVTDCLAVNFFGWVVIGMASFEPLPFLPTQIGAHRRPRESRLKAGKRSLPDCPFLFEQLGLFYADLQPASSRAERDGHLDRRSVAV